MLRWESRRVRSEEFTGKRNLMNGCLPLPASKHFAMNFLCRMLKFSQESRADSIGLYAGTESKTCRGEPRSLS